MSISARADPALSEDVENLARRIAEGHPSLLHLARGIADAQADVRRVRQIRSHKMAKALANFGSERDDEELLAILGRCIRFDTFGRTLRKREKRLERLFSGARLTPTEEVQAIQDFLRETARMRQVEKRARRDVIRYGEKSRAEFQARILRGLAEELARLDRYERRALSRRKFAIREFDAARTQSGS